MTDLVQNWQIHCRETGFGSLVNVTNTALSDTPFCYGSASCVGSGGVLVSLVLIGCIGITPPASADRNHDPYFNEDSYIEFYTPPDPLPAGQPGDLIRSEPSRLVLEPSGQLGAIMATGTRIMYRSNDARGSPMAVTGTYFEPFDDWPGRGPRPLIVYGPGTQGQGDQCAPSRQFNQGIHFSPYLDVAFNYEELFVATMVARGFAIVMTDYQGLGTPGVHTHVNRVAAGDVMLDAARASMRLPDTRRWILMGPLPSGDIRKVGERRPPPPNWRRRMRPSCSSSALTPVPRPPTSRSSSPTRTVVRWWGWSGMP